MNRNKSNFPKAGGQCRVPDCKNHTLIGQHVYCPEHERFLKDLLYFLPRVLATMQMQERVAQPKVVVPGTKEFSEVVGLIVNEQEKRTP
jgi:hypothetical protein